MHYFTEQILHVVYAVVNRNLFLFFHFYLFMGKMGGGRWNLEFDGFQASVEKKKSLKKNKIKWIQVNRYLKISESSADLLRSLKRISFSLFVFLYLSSTSNMPSGFWFKIKSVFPISKMSSILVIYAISFAPIFETPI